MSPRTLLRQMFEAAVDAAQPSHCLPQHLPAPPKGRTLVIGAGKASAEMARVVEQHWPGELTGLVVTRYGYKVPCERIEIVEAAHPVPDAAGLAAALRIRAWRTGELVQEDTTAELLFPFARELIAGAVTSGGYPPLMLDPVDFVALYRQKMSQMAPDAQAPTTA